MRQIRYIVLFAMILLLLSACSTAQSEQTIKADKPFQDLRLCMASVTICN